MKLNTFYDFVIITSFEVFTQFLPKFYLFKVLLIFMTFPVVEITFPYTRIFSKTVGIFQGV